MDLTTYQRTDKKKGTVNSLRREGNIPAVLYSKGQEGTSLAVNGHEFRQLLRNLKQGTLATTIFDLKGDGFQCRAIVKGIQYHVTSYDVLHLDLMELHEDTEITVKVPIQCIHIADCIGVKAGGVLRQVIRAIKVSCLPKNLPTEFDVDVKDLGMKQTIRLKEINFPEGVTPVAALEEVAVVVAKR
jgi:large subunit ribosomal protein L25